MLRRWNLWLNTSHWLCTSHWLSTTSLIGLSCTHKLWIYKILSRVMMHVIMRLRYILLVKTYVLLWNLVVSTLRQTIRLSTLAYVLSIIRSCILSILEWLLCIPLSRWGNLLLVWLLKLLLLLMQTHLNRISLHHILILLMHLLIWLVLLMLLWKSILICRSIVRCSHLLWMLIRIDHIVTFVVRVHLYLWLLVYSLHSRLRLVLRMLIMT